jgi:transposase-like protein
MSGSSRAVRNVGIDVLYRFPIRPSFPPLLIETEHRQIKYRNDVIEADHGKLKRRIKPTLDLSR